MVGGCGQEAASRTTRAGASTVCARSPWRCRSGCIYGSARVVAPHGLADNSQLVCPITNGRIACAQECPA